MPVAVRAAKIIAREDNIKPETGKVAKQVKGAAADLGMMTISLSDYLTQRSWADLICQKQKIEMRFFSNCQPLLSITLMKIIQFRNN